VLRGLEQQVSTTIQQGARLLVGGRAVARPGYFYPPTVLVDAPPDSPARQQELFGPVATLIRVDGIDEALRIANETSFGLGSSLWTTDSSERDLFIDRVEAGVAFVNGMVASDPALPFGGIKQSGYGRELSSQGIREFVNIKTVAIQETDPRPGAPNVTE
jgi:succinate-semialdehyde dehydrogenase/glutarate-semialdehyde dehydrogenase